MEPVFENSPDIEWSCVTFHNLPMLVLQATGPVVTSDWLQREFKTVALKYTFDVTPTLDMKPTTFLCVADGHTDRPVLAADIEPMLDPLIRAVKGNKPWLLVLQYKVEGKEFTKMFITHKDRTEVFGDGILDHWIVAIR